MSKMIGNKVGEEICKALGLDSSNIAEVDILLRAGSAAYVEIIRYIESTEIGSIIKILEEYEITKVKDDS